MNYIESWESAEIEIFNRLRGALGGEEGKDCFIGYMPYRDGVWMLTTGGSNTASDQDRLAAAGQMLSCFNLLASVESFAVDRKTAQRFALSVYEALKDETNYHNVGNVEWFHAIGMPESPELVELPDGGMLWRVAVPCQIIFHTSNR